MTDIVDSVIVGAGIAGLSAAVFLARADRTTLVFDGGEPRIFAVDEVREYVGFDGMPTSEVMERSRAEAVRYGADIRPARVESIDPRGDGLFVVHATTGPIVARTIVLATGLVDELPDVTGIPRAWGRDLRVCPCFDGYEVQGGRFVVFGVGEKLAHMASWVRMWSPDVTVVSPQRFSDAEAERLNLLGIRTMRDEVAGLVHDGDRLVGVTTASGTHLDCDATWVAMNARAASDLAASLCEIDELGFAKTDASGATSRPGVYAIGNADEPWAHMAHAAASGTTVGPVVTMYLLERMLIELRMAKAA